MDYESKLVYQSNYWYNDGLRRAGIRDLTGAIASLRRSLQYNRANIAARNLLGLAYYGRGDVVEALVEWILSKNYQNEDNIANDYIEEVQKVPGELEDINEAVRRYNQSLTYARENGEDMAIIQLKKAVELHPTFVKAHQLLALLYLQTEQYSSARSEIRAAQRLDTTDPVTLKYMHELDQIRKSRPVRIQDPEKQKEQTVTYNLGNETIIQPAPTGVKENSNLRTVLNIGIGVVVGVAVMWFLILPAVISSRQADINDQTLAFSERIATEEAQISALRTELDEYRTTADDGEDNSPVTVEETQEAYEALMMAQQGYDNDTLSQTDLAELLLSINPNALSESARADYTAMTADVYPDVCTSYYEAAQESLEYEQYEDAQIYIERVLQMDETYDYGGAYLIMAQCLEAQGEQDEANAYYRKVTEDYAGGPAAIQAQNALDIQNGEAVEEQEELEDELEDVEAEYE